MSKVLVYDVEAKTKILDGILKLEKAVSTTLGPCGKNVIIDEYGTIHSTKDGVTVAKSITLKDPFENIGANAIKEVAEKSNVNVGDGTTTSTILAASIYNSGLKFVTMGSNATQIKNGIKKAADKVIEYVQSISQPVKEAESIKRVATVSANGDEHIGSIIAEVMSKIGKDGSIKIENGNALTITSDIKMGMAIGETYISPYMISNPETLETELDDVFILLVDKKITNIQELLPPLQSVSKSGKTLLIIAEDYQDDIVATLVMNKLRGFNLVAVKAPMFGIYRKQILQDIATLTGGKVVSDEGGVFMKNATTDSGILGKAKKVLCNKDSTMIIDGFGIKEEIDSRANAIKTQLESSQDQYEKAVLRDRLAKLTSGIGIINVGGVTESERKETRDRVDDAFCAAKAAVKNGIVPGGGVALLLAQSELEKWIKDEPLTDDEKIGCTILMNALSAPITKILKNAGIELYSSIIMQIKEEPQTKRFGLENIGYDVIQDKFVDMLNAGILDPTDVVINEVRNSAAVSGLLLTTECLITDDPEDKEIPQQFQTPAMM